jgi:dTMP kinase
MSLFITFEGGDGCGKSTQADVLYKRLVESNVPVELTCEPGGTPLGDELRSLLKRKWDVPIAPETELLLFAASRKQLVTNVIRPALAQGKTVICDRFVDSTVAYQGYGSRIDLGIVNTINQFVTGGIKPDLTTLLDMPCEQAVERKHNRATDRFDSDDLEFHQRVRQGFLALARSEPGRWLVISASLPADQISRVIWDRVSQLLA